MALVLCRVLDWSTAETKVVVVCGAEKACALVCARLRPGACLGCAGWDMGGLAPALLLAQLGSRAGHLPGTRCAPETLRGTLQLRLRALLP